MIGDNLKKLRKERGWTQKELEDRTGIAQRNISSYEAGKLKPSGRTISRFAAAFEVTVEDLVGDNSKEPALALDDTELLTMFREVEKLPEADKARLKWVISLALRQNRIQEMMAS
jgi:transcriptional regulator with XRE-family HTH domain